MKKIMKATATLASFAVLAACSGNSGDVVLHPGPAPKTPVVGQYVQIERLSRPAVKEVFEPFQQHQITNGLEPYQTGATVDPLQADIMTTEDVLRPPNTTAGSDYGKALQGVLYPDEYTVNLNGPAPSGADPYYFLSDVADSGGTAFGGRAPNDDVIYLELAALFGPLLGELGAQPEDGEENTCLASQNIGGVEMPGGENAGKTAGNTFPYLAAAH